MSEYQFSVGGAMLNTPQGLVVDMHIIVGQAKFNFQFPTANIDEVDRLFANTFKQLRQINRQQATGLVIPPNGFKLPPKEV